MVMYWAYWASGQNDVCATSEEVLTRRFGVLVRLLLGLKCLASTLMVHPGKICGVSKCQKSFSIENRSFLEEFPTLLIFKKGPIE